MQTDLTFRRFKQTSRSQRRYVAKWVRMRSATGEFTHCIQENLPIAYRRKSLSETEKRCARIEKEALTIPFGCKKFH